MLRQSTWTLRRSKRRSRQPSGTVSRFTVLSRQNTDSSRHLKGKKRAPRPRSRQSKRITRQLIGTLRQYPGTLRRFPGTSRHCTGTSRRFPGTLAQCTRTLRRCPGGSRQLAGASPVRRPDCDTVPGMGGLLDLQDPFHHPGVEGADVLALARPPGGLEDQAGGGAGLEQRVRGQVQRLDREVVGHAPVLVGEREPHLFAAVYDEGG